MSAGTNPTRAEVLPRFTRDLRSAEGRFSSIGGGVLGGKATGLLAARDILARTFPGGERGGIRVDVPALAVIGSEVFDAFLARNELADYLDDASLSDERIAHAFLGANFPTEFLGDLQTLAAAAHTPLAVRSSSRLEDATHEPFAGIYATKLVPNNQPAADSRFRKLIEAVKFVWASTFFREARGYRAMAHRSSGEEKMAVILQEVVGHRYEDRFYPAISGVGRTWNWYASGAARPEDGVIQLALGLGRQVVNGGKCWTYSPARPAVAPPFTMRDMLWQTQTTFWAVGMGAPPEYDPTCETEYLEKSDLQVAEMDGSLSLIASTYDSTDDVIRMGLDGKGARVLDFAPILKLPGSGLKDVIHEVLLACRRETGKHVEIEFAITVDPLERESARFGLLQVRPIATSPRVVDLHNEDIIDERVLVRSDSVLGNGVTDQVTDIIYVRPDVFDKGATRQIATEIGELNRQLAAEGRDCILVVIGRLGSSERWLGIPVDWGQISQAKVIVEATTPEMNVDLSQGSHFFHNLTSLQILFFTVKHSGPYVIRWDLLEAADAFRETKHLRHLRLPEPLKVRVDGRRAFGTIEWP